MIGFMEQWITERKLPNIGKLPRLFSNHWKLHAADGTPAVHFFQPLEKPILQQSNTPAIHSKKRGAALIVVMWVLLIVSLIVSTFAFEMQLEARLISAQRKRFKADQLALAGVELAKTMLAFEKDPFDPDDVVYDDPYRNKASSIAKGIPVDFTEEIGDGTLTLHIDFEEGRRNIHKLSAEEWHEIFDQAGIPNVEWDSMLGALTDWEDENDLSQLNGAEKDDWFYREKGYGPKNAPVDTVDELLLIKGWEKEYLYGTGTNENVEIPIRGMAGQLTTWGNGEINPNTIQEVLNSIPNLSEGTIDAIMDAQLGPDGESGTEDDGITQEDLAALGLGAPFSLKPKYVTLLSEGSVGGVVSTISAVFKLGGKESAPLFWLEE